MRADPERVAKKLREIGAPPSAEQLTWEEAMPMVRDLGRMIVADCEPGVPHEVFQAMALLPRGGHFTGDLLARAFEFPGDKLLHPSVTTYKPGGTDREEGEEVKFIYGPMPARQHVEGKSILIVDEVCDRGHTLKEVVRILTGELGANSIKTGVLHYKPTKSETGFVPDYYVATTANWIVYPWEIYEHFKLESLDESLWLPNFTNGEEENG